MKEVAEAYSTTGEAWERGPARVYDRLADVLADRCPVPLAGSRVLDLGAGTGAATRAAQRRGADVIAVDVATGMLMTDAATRPSAAVADALALPFASRSFDAVIAAFSLNHLTDPVSGLREAARVLVAGGGLVAGAYAEDDTHPVKAATSSAAEARGWSLQPWYTALAEDAMPHLATVERARRTARHAGLGDVDVEHVRVPFPDLEPEDLVRWRLGMAQLAPFVATLSAAEVQGLIGDAVARLGDDPPVLERAVIVITHRVAGRSMAVNSR